VRVLRTLLLSAVLAVGVAAPAAAQTTTTSSTTMPPVRSIPVTPAPGVTTTTTARATTTTTAAVSGSGESAAPAMADTGIAADKLVPLGFLLIALGAALTGASRRYGRPAYTFL
jgi:hypothetical protein